MLLSVVVGRAAPDVLILTELPRGGAFFKRLCGCVRYYLHADVLLLWHIVKNRTMLSHLCNQTDIIHDVASTSADCVSGDEDETAKANAFDAEYVFYAADLDVVRQSWSNDRAFYPSTITYGLAFVVGLTGNLLVVIALISDRKSRNVTSTFMISLAMADLVFILVCVPYEAANKFFSYWAGGLALCKLVGFVEMLSALTSVLNLTAVSVERYVINEFAPITYVSYDDYAVATKKAV